MANIMIVDDAAFMRMVLRNILVQGGHTVVAEAKTGLEAISMYDRHRPDLVTMDITMPDLEGVDAVKKIIEKHADAKIIMISAMGQQATVAESIRSGAKSFLVKPFEAEKVLGEISKVLAM